MIYSDARVVAPKLLRARGGRKARLASAFQPLARESDASYANFRIRTKLPCVSESLGKLFLVAAAALPPSRPRLF